MGSRRHYNRPRDLERRLAGSHRGTAEGLCPSFSKKKKTTNLSLVSAARGALFGVLAGILPHGVSIKNREFVIFVRGPVLSLPAAPHTDWEAGEEASCCRQPRPGAPDRAEQEGLGAATV